VDSRLVFDNIAAEYDKWRPAYPPELYADIFSYTNITETSRVLEVGIGTGKATLPILETNCRLTAVELGDKMAAYARRKFAEYDNIEVIQGAFEDYDGPGDAYDFIYGACTFHWIPEEIGYPKVFSLLKNGGAFARFANWQQKDKENEPLNAAIQRVYAQCMSGTAPPKPEYTEADCKRLADVAGEYGFVDMDYRMYHRKRVFNAEGFVSLQRTHGGHADMSEDQWATFAGGIREAINQHGGNINVYDIIELQLARKP